ncbi:MAG: hypothetical protein QMB92_09905, partial [Thiopseudomonas sp.]
MRLALIAGFAAILGGCAGKTTDTAEAAQAAPARVAANWSQDQQQKHTENIAVDPCDGNNPWNMNNTTLGHRRHSICQTPKSQEQCIEAWLANG